MAYRNPPTTFWVWRFMIDAAHQGKGYGRSALELLVDEALKDGVDEVKLSYHPGEYCPHEFYTRFGFVDTGEFEQGRSSCGSRSISRLRGSRGGTSSPR
jgi:GNAT superfamily N-acetyltransferase